MTSTPTPSTPHHRHFVAAPLVVAALMMVWGSLGAERLSGGRAAHVLAEAPVTVQTAGGSAQGAIFAVQNDLIRMESGTVLVRAEGVVELESRGVFLHIAAGIARVEQSGSGLTIEALSAPVLVKIAADVVAVPAGMRWQWDGQALPTLDDGLLKWWDARRPQDLVASRALNLLALSGASLPSARTLSRGEAWSGPWQAALSLPVAQSRSREREASDRLSTLSAALQAGQSGAALVALGRAQAAGAFQTDFGRAQLPALLSKSAAVPAVTLAVADEMAQSPDGWLLLPLLSSAPSLALLPEPPAETALEVRLSQALLLPLADRGREGLSAIAVRQWSDSLLPLANETDQPALLPELVGRELTDVIAKAAYNGWVERAERYGLAQPNAESK